MSDKIFPVTMPRWGLSMTEGKVSGWLVPLGGKVAKGQDVVDIETEKITNVHESPAAGVLRRQVLALGSVAPVGGLIAVVADPSVPDSEIEAFVAGFKAPAPSAVEGGDTGPKPRQVDVRGGVWNYLDIGDPAAPALVLVHGFGGDLNNWMFNWPALESAARIIAVDLPGHGASGKTVAIADLSDLSKGLLDFLEALKIDRAHLAGHSLGGVLAGLAALAKPGLARSLTLIASMGLGPEIDDEYLAGFIAAEKRRDLQAVVGRLFANQELVSRELVEGLLRFKRLDGVGTALKSIRAAMVKDGKQRVSLMPDLAKLAAPVRVIWGAEDKIIPAAQARALAAPFKIQVLEGAGHMAHMERAKDVNGALVEAVRS